MKNIFKNITYICLIMGFVISCTTNEYEIPNNGGGNALLVSSINDGLRPGEIEVRVGDTSKYTDLSVFSEDRLWTFPEGAVDILGSSNDITTDKKEFSVVFKDTEDGNPRSIEVLLQPIFNGPVPPEAATDTAFVRILPHIRASFTNDIPEVDGALKLEAGNVATFTNTSSELESAEWVIFNNTTNTIKGDTIKTINVENERFTSLGSYTVRLRAFDDMPFSQDFVSLNFEVIPSSEPLILEPEIREDGDGEITLRYSRDLDPSSLDPISNFTLMVDAAPATISSVMVDPDNPANLVVTPAVNIKNTQTATLAYMVTNLQSSDAAPAPSLATTAIEAFNPNLFTKDPTFEEGDIQWGNPFGNNTTGVFRTRVSPGNNSNFAMSIQGVDVGNNFQIAITDAFEVKAGNQIRLTFDYKLPPGFPGNTNFTFRIYEFPGFSDLYRNFTNVGCCGLVADGTWQTRTVILGDGSNGPTTVPSDFSGSIFMQIIADPSGGANPEILLDNFRIEHVEL
ncbi:hypothetical protein [Aquimarina algiphila]|uniref:hypothetical protein n=1 Tax=Aquimarina algiphila TaxID=2047982 RepID=UPI00232B421D|nr:hypothetical protein [Aquimarina algiphila]